MVVSVLANIEFEPEELINEVARDYKCSVAELSMDNIVEYIENHITYMKGINTNVIKSVDDGPSIDGIEERDSFELFDILDQMQNELEET